MTYFPPVVTAAGLSVPTFNDIQQALIDAYQGIYGSTTYLGNDSADYQWITSVALKLFDNESLCQLAYNSRSPLTAIGVALDEIVKINGIARIAPTNSTVTLLLTGIDGTQVVNGVAQDINGVQWALPAVVNIGPSGSVSEIATCMQAGAISAQPNTINTPVGGFTAGWLSVTNPIAAVVGTVPESDSSLRARQSIAVATPSSTRLAGTQAAIEAVPGVTRVSVLENQTSVTDANGNASHSITCVVEGGDPQMIATAIYNNKGIGANTLGANPAADMVTENVTDPNTGNVTTIGFVRPTYVPIYVSMNIHPLTPPPPATPVLTPDTQTAIKNAVADYLQKLDIGEMVTQSALYGAALSVMPDLTNPDFSIRALYLGTSSSPTGTSDIPMTFYQVAQGSPANVTITTV